MCVFCKTQNSFTLYLSILYHSLVPHRSTSWSSNQNLHLYSHHRFSKILRPFCASRNWWIIVVFLQRNSLTITIVSKKYQELLQPYSHDRLAKIPRTFCASRNKRIIVVFLQHTLKEKLPIFLINTLLLHIPLLALTDRQNDRRRDKYTHCAWAGGMFFPVVLLCSFWFWRRIGCGFIYLRT
jgi:hypothetical protein